MVKWFCVGIKIPNQDSPSCGLVLDIKVVKNPTGFAWNIDLYCPVCGMEMARKPRKKEELK